MSNLERQKEALEQYKKDNNIFKNQPLQAQNALKPISSQSAAQKGAISESSAPRYDLSAQTQDFIGLTNALENNDANIAQAAAKESQEVPNKNYGIDSGLNSNSAAETFMPPDSFSETRGEYRVNTGIKYFDSQKKDLSLVDAYFAKQLGLNVTPQRIINLEINQNNRSINENITSDKDILNRATSSMKNIKSSQNDLNKFVKKFGGYGAIRAAFEQGKFKVFGEVIDNMGAEFNAVVDSMIYSIADGLTKDVNDRKQIRETLKKNVVNSTNPYVLMSIAAANSIQIANKAKQSAQTLKSHAMRNKNYLAAQEFEKRADTIYKQAEHFHSAFGNDFATNKQAYDEYFKGLNSRLFN